MTSTRRSNLHSDVNTHPDDSILLAYLRGQKLETRSSVIQHIESEKCPVCFQKLNELEQVTNVLEVLGETRSHQAYPEVTVAATYARIEGIAQQRSAAETATRHGKYPQRPGTSAIRLISVPLGVGLALLFTAMLVFAGLSVTSINPFSSGGTRHSQNMWNVTVLSHSNSTSQTSEVKEPQMKVCSRGSDHTQLRLVICGFHFDSSHHATLVIYVPGKKPLWLRDINVDKNGELRVEWTIHDCRNVPTSIYAYEVTNSKPIEVALQISSFGRCTGLTTPYQIK